MLLLFYPGFWTTVASEEASDFPEMQQKKNPIKYHDKSIKSLKTISTTKLILKNTIETGYPNNHLNTALRFSGLHATLECAKRP